MKRKKNPIGKNIRIITFPCEIKKFELYQIASTQATQIADFQTPHTYLVDSHSLVPASSQLI